MMNETESDEPSTPEFTPVHAAELEQLRSGGEKAVAELFSKYRSRFERMVSFRLDRRLYGRIDAEDILQESYIEISRRIGDYLEGGLFLWLLTHPELRNTARVMAFMRFMRKVLDRDFDLLEGRKPA